MRPTINRRPPPSALRVLLCAGGSARPWPASWRRASTLLLASAGLAVLVVAAPAARAQSADGFGDAAAARVTSTSQAAARSSSTGSADASTLFGLVEPAGGRKPVTLDELLSSLGEAPDARIARERVAQGEAARRRAWALLLPTLSLSGVYTLTCTGGGGGVDCADRTANVGDPKSIEQQVLLFRSLADIFGAAADASTDPADVARYRAQQEDLAAAADDIAGRAGAAPVVVQPASQLAGQMTLAVPLLNPRAYPALLNAGDGVSVAELGVQQARQSLGLVVVRGYYAAWTAQRLVEVGARQVALADEQRAAVAARVAAATQPPLSLKRAELELLRAKQTLAVARAAADNAVAALGAALGRTEMFTLAPPPAAPPEPAGDDGALVERALRDRVEVRVQRLAVAIAERGTLDAWMQFVPTVGVSATARATSFTSGFVKDPVTGVVSLSASVPLYDGGARYAALDDASSKTSEERQRLQQLQDRVAAQVRGNRRDVAVRSEAVALAREALVVATEAHTQAQALFDAGVGTALDLSDTAVAVFAAESEAVRAEGELAVARLSLRWALGEAVPSPPSTTAPPPSTTP